MPYGPGSNALVTDSLPPTGDTVEEAINKLDAQLEALYDGLNAAEQQVTVQFKGEWSDSSTYQCNDVVTSGDATYICKNTGGSPAGTAVTNTAYWAELTAKIEFATSEELSAGTATDKAIAPDVAKAAHDSLKELITALESRAGALETLTSTGVVGNAAKLNGQGPAYYRCSSGCSWTCSSGCTGGCGNGCTGSCLAGCTGGCSSCTGNCTGSCSGSCSNTCLTTCTSGCTGCTAACRTGCETSCTGGCKNGCPSGCRGSS